MSETIRELYVSLSLNTGNFQKDIKGAQEQVKQAEAKFRAASVGVKGFENTVAGMQARVQMLKDKLQAQNTVVEKSAAAFEKVKQKVADAIKRQQDLATKVDKAKASYLSQAEATGKDSEETAKLKVELEKLQGQYAANEKSIPRYAQEVQKSETALIQAQAAMKGMGIELRAAEANFQKNGSWLGQAKKKLDELSNGAATFGKKMSDAGGKLTRNVTVPILGVAAASFKAWDTIDNGMDTVIRKTGATGAALVPLEDAYNKVFGGIKTTAEDAGIAIGEVNARFKAQGEELAGLSKLFIQFADVNQTDLNASIGNTSKVLAQWQRPASDAAGFLGLLTSESQRTGISVDRLMDSVQANGATLKGMGLNLSQSVQLMADFEAAGVNADVALAALKKSAGAYAKEGVSLEQGLAATINAIRTANTETTALAIAQKAFGAKGALEMATAIREGRLSVTGLTADMSKMGDVVGRTFQEINNDTPIMDRVKNRLIQVGASLGKSQVVPWIEQASLKLEGLLNGFMNLNPAMQQTALNGVALAAVTGPALTGFGKMATGISALSKLFTGPAGWVTLAITALAGLGIAVARFRAKLEEESKIKISVEGKEKITSAMQSGTEAANATARVIEGVAADALELQGIIDSALSNKDISKKEFNAISAFILGKVNPDIEAGKTVLAAKVAEYKKVLDSAVDANGNKYSDEDKDVMLADFEAKNAKLLVDVQAAKDNYFALLNQIQTQTSPVTDAQIAQLNEQAGKLFAITEQLRLANDAVAAAGEANYNLTVTGQGDERTAGSAMGYVQGKRFLAENAAAQKREAALGLAKGDADLAKKAWADYDKEMADIAANTQTSFQAILDGVAKMSGASDQVKTINQDYEALAKTLQVLSNTGIYFDDKGGWIQEFNNLFGPNGALGKYAPENSALRMALDKLLVPENAGSYYRYKDVRDLVQGLQENIAGALFENSRDPKMNPVFTAYQSMLDAGYLKDLDTSNLDGALESVIKSNDMVRLVDEQGKSAVDGLSNSITVNTPTAVNAVHNMFAAMIREANIMRPLLNNAMGFIASGNAGGVTVGGRTNTYNSTANLNIGNFNASSQVDIDVLQAAMAANNRRARAGRGHVS